jgi:hypothetical protein
MPDFNYLFRPLLLTVPNGANSRPISDVLPVDLRDGAFFSGQRTFPGPSTTFTLKLGIYQEPVGREKRDPRTEREAVSPKAANFGARR